MEWLNKGLNKARAALRIRRSPWRSPLEDLPPGLESTWRETAPQEYEGIRTDAFFFACAAEGLMAFFDAVTTTRRACALPSEAADSVWHAWLRWDADSLDRFCWRHFGAPVPHIERAALGEGALLNTFAACRRRESGPVGRLRLPRLFALDASLRMPGGHGYWLYRGDVAYARIGQSGHGFGRAGTHPELTSHALYGAGLIDRGALLASLERQHPRRRETTDGGSGCGGLSFADGGGDGGCGDGGGGGDGGGSSCGSSCGGGCGGD